MSAPASPAAAARCTAALLLGLLLSACGGFSAFDLLPSFRSDAAPQTAALWREDIVIAVEGQLAGGAALPDRCRLLYPESGDPYALIGDTRAYPPGARIRVTGPIALWSPCETFRTLKAEQVEALP